VSGAGPNWAAIERALAAIEAAIYDHPSFLRSGGVTPDDPAFEANRNKLDQLARDLAAQMQRLSSGGNFIDLLERQAWQVPREHRYPFRQRIRNHRGKLETLYARAVNLKQVLLDTIRRDATITPLDAMGWLADQQLEHVKTILKQDSLQTEKLLAQGKLMQQNVSTLVVLAVIVAALIHQAWTGRKHHQG
jgi:hypothetical protein